MPRNASFVRKKSSGLYLRYYVPTHLQERLKIKNIIRALPDVGIQMQRRIAAEAAYLLDRVMKNMPPEKISRIVEKIMEIAVQRVNNPELSGLINLPDWTSSSAPAVQSVPQPTPIPPKTPGKPVSEAVEGFYAWAAAEVHPATGRPQKRPITEATLTRYRSGLAAFLRITEEKLHRTPMLTDIDDGLLESYAAAAAQLPGGRGDGIARANSDVRISDSALCNGHFAAVRRFLRYCTEFVKGCPFTGAELQQWAKLYLPLKIGNVSGGEAVLKRLTEQVIFTEAQLEDIFDPDRYVDTFCRSRAGGPWTGRFWVPIIRAFTGARSEEIAQLKKRHLIEVKDPHGRKKFWCFAIIEGQDEHVKNIASQRILVLPQRLIDMKILAYLEGKNFSGDMNLWGLEKTSGDGYDRSITRNWPKYIEKLNKELNSGISIPYYNLRHTFLSVAQTNLSRDEFLIANTYTGHADEEISESTAAYLAENIEKTKKIVDTVAKNIPIDTQNLSKRFWETLKKCGE